ncbi:Uncharacterised protein [uncultured archaeon]|nr:Uncharacterised protein [uncultured archaeon]
MKRYIILSLAIAVLIITIIHPVLARMEDLQQTSDQKSIGDLGNAGDQKNKSDGQNSGDRESMDRENISYRENRSYREEMNYAREKASKMMEEGKSMRQEREMEGMGFLSSEDNSYGEYVNFAIDRQNSSILNYAINGTPLFNISCDFNFRSIESEGSQTRIEDTSGETIIRIHDNPSAIINIMTKSNGSASSVRHIAFALASGVTAAKEDSLIRIGSGDVVGYVGGANATSISTGGGQVKIEMPANSYAFFRAAPVNLNMSYNLQKKVSQEIEDNGVGMEIAFGRNRTVNAINYSERMNLSIREMEKDRIRLSINSSETAGRIIIMNLDNASLVIGHGERLRINYDSEPLDCGDNPDMIFNGTDRPLCWISSVQDSKGQIMIYVPHYSQHTIEILVEPETTPAEPAGTAQGARTVTLADDGKTITLEVNETFLLNLGQEYDWNISIDDQTVISREVNVLVVRGAQGIYRAHKPGRATLIAAGDPACRKSVPPCAVPSRQFRVYVVVSGGPTDTQKAPAFEAVSVIGMLMTALLLARR